MRDLEKASVKVITQNKKAWHDYFIDEKYEAGIELYGTEVKSIRERSAQITDSFCIVRDGEVLYSFDLSKEENRSFVIEYGDSSNTVEIKDGKIRVSEAECPDKTCVRTGWLSSSAMPIVCLPNHLIIEFADENSEIDALAE